MKFNKKIMKIIGISGIVLGILTGCSSKNIPDKDLTVNKCIVSSNVEAPKWICTHNLDYSKEYSNYIIGVGSAPKLPDLNLQVQEAMGAARDEISQKVSTTVKNMLKKYAATTGTKENLTFEKATEFVSKQLSYSRLNGTKIITSWRNPKNGEIYILMGISKDNAKHAIDSAVKSSFKNNKPLWQKFLASKAYKELNKEFNEK